MNSIDLKTAIHAGVEVIALGGIIFWFTRKNNQLSAEILELRAKVSEMEKMIAGMHTFLTNGQNPRIQQSNDNKTVLRPRMQKVQNEPELDDSDLDAILNEELQEKGKCEDGICMLPEQELKKSTE